MNRENYSQPARNTNLSGCLPSLAKVRHGVCVTTEGWLVHWSTLDSDTVWDHMCLDLDLDNYITIYSSKFFNKKKDMEDNEKRQILDEIINGLGTLHDITNSSAWDLKMVDVTRNYDLLLGFASTETSNQMSIEGKIIVETQSQGELIIPCGPVVPHGVINYKRYLVRVAMTPGVPQWRILEELHKIFKVRETEVNTLKIGETDVPVQKGGMVCYLEFPTCSAAIDMQKEIEVDGVPVKLWHKGYYECSICNEKGHTKDYHEQVMKAKANNVKRRAARNRRRQQSN